MWGTSDGKTGYAVEESSRGSKAWTCFRNLNTTTQTLRQEDS